MSGKEEKSLPSSGSDQDGENTVGWDGLDDPKNPLNWPAFIRYGHVILVSIITLSVNLASTMFAPGAAQLMHDFHSTDSTIGSLTVTIYILGFALGPLVVAPLSELYGRQILYNTCNTMFLSFTIGCALSTNIGMFLAFRFIAGVAGSAPLTIGGGTVTDLIPQEKRGGAMALFAMGPLLGPIIGPIAGGYLTQVLSWRWVFWILAILSGVLAITALIFMRETFAPVLLARKTALLRKTTGNLYLVSKLDSGLTPRELFIHSIVRPIRMLLFSPIVLLLSLFTALIFGLTFLLFTTFPAVFKEQYKFNTGAQGLSYLGMGIGCLVGVFIFSKLSDKVLKKLTGDGEMKPEYRLPLMVWISPIIGVGFFWYGWSAYYKVHWIVPIIGTFFIGVGSLFVIMPAQTYLVDAFGPYAASALAANALLRSLLGTFLPLAGPKMYKSLGLGWGNSLLGFLALAFAPVPFFFYRHGEQARKRWVFDL